MLRLHQSFRRIRQIFPHRRPARPPMRPPDHLRRLKPMLRRPSLPHPVHRRVRINQHSIQIKQNSPTLHSNHAQIIPAIPTPLAFDVPITRQSPTNVERAPLPTLSLPLTLFVVIPNAVLRHAEAELSRSREGPTSNAVAVEVPGGPSFAASAKGGVRSHPVSLRWVAASSRGGASPSLHSLSIRFS